MATGHMEPHLLGFLSVSMGIVAACVAGIRASLRGPDFLHTRRGSAAFAISVMVIACCAGVADAMDRSRCMWRGDWCLGGIHVPYVSGGVLVWCAEPM